MWGKNMENEYLAKANLFKAISDPNRLMIVDMLSRGILCACKILEKLQITQPTLSHHMKILCDCGLVDVQREGKWMYYSLNSEKLRKMMKLLVDIISDTEGCICKNSVEVGKINEKHRKKP